MSNSAAMAPAPAFYEFFCGGGMARAGLAPEWRCLFANDFDPRKGAAYAANWGGEALTVADVASLRAEDLPGNADLAWASFPCQDLSLAGAAAGLDGARSGAFWGFCAAMAALKADGRAPKLIALENVAGVLTSKGGADFAAIAAALQRLGYRYGALTIDAADFLPQSRPRVFCRRAAPRPRAPAALAGAGPPPASRVRRAPARRWPPAPRGRGRLALVAGPGAAAAEPPACRIASEAPTLRRLAFARPDRRAGRRAFARLAARRRARSRDRRAAMSARSSGARGPMGRGARGCRRRRGSTASPAACARRPAGRAASS